MNMLEGSGTRFRGLSGRVVVDQDHSVPLLAQRADGLRAAVVELGRLADDDGPGTQDEDALQVGAFGHLSLQSSCVRERRPVRASFAASRRDVPVRLSVGAGI
jgi:hypothetical protein